MKKRFLSILLTLTMLLSLMPGMSLTASAEDHPEHTFGYPTTFTKPIGNYNELNTFLTADPDFANYRAYLTSDITLTADITVKERVTNVYGHAICLNGHTINMNGHSIKVQANLFIYDCKTDVTHKFTVQENGLWKLDSNGTKTVTGGGLITNAGGHGAFELLGTQAAHLVLGGVKVIGNQSSDANYGGAVTAPAFNSNLISIEAQGRTVVRGNVANGTTGESNILLKTSLNQVLSIEESDKYRLCDGADVGITMSGPSLTVGTAIDGYIRLGGTTVMINPNTTPGSDYFTFNQLGSKTMYAVEVKDNQWKLKPAHTHQFAYKAVGNTINAYCTNTEGASSCPYQGTDTNLAKAITLTLSASNATYDGNAKSASIGNWSASGVDKLAAKPTTISYAGRESTTYSSNTAPKDVGDYKASITVGGATASVDFEITKANPTITTYPAAIANLVYNSNEQELISAGTSSHGTFQYSLDGTNWVDSAADIKGTNAGDYTVYYRLTGDSNHNDKTSAQISNVKIGKAASSLTTAPTAKTDLVYDGTEQALVNAGSGADGGTLKYSTTQNGTYSETIPTGKDAKTDYVVWYKVVGDSNHSDTTAQSITSIAIAKKPVTVSDLTASNKTFDGNTTATIVGTNAAFDGLVEGDFLTVTANGTFASINVAENINVAISDLALGGTSINNYQLATTGHQESTTANITKKDVTVTITPNGGTYSETITGAAAAVNGAVAEHKPNVTLTYSDSNTTAVPQNAGTYTVTAALSGEEAGNYNLTGTTTANFTVNKKTVTVSGIKAENKTYDTTTVATLNYDDASFNGLKDGDVLTITAVGTFTDANVGVGKTVNLTNPVLGGDSIANYALADSGNQSTTTATITKLEIAKPAPQNVTATYDGEHHVVTVPENEWYTVTDNDKVNVGAYTTVVALKDKNNTCWNDEGKTTVDVTATLTINPLITIYKKGDDKFTPIIVLDTELDGSYSLPSGTTLAPGTYQVVVNTGNKTVTSILNVVKGEEPELKVNIPEKAVSSVVEVKPATEDSKVATPDATVGGLEDVAKAHAVDGSSVTVKLIVEAKPVVTDKEHPDDVQEAIKAKDEAKGKTIEYLDIQIEKYVNTVKQDNITDTGTNLIEIVVPFKTSGRTGFKVLRYHNGAAEALTELKDTDSATEGSFRVDTKAGTVTIYASKFSTYAVAYNNVSSSGSNSITLPTSVEHGKVTLDKKSASANQTVTITVTPDKGFTLETLTVTDKNGKEVEVKNLGNNKYSFKMPSGKVTVNATFMEDNTMLNFFVDVKATDYYYDAVLWAAENDITKGTDDVHFSPSMGTTRAQVVTFLWRAAGCPEPTGDASKFVDVKADSYYEKAVAWAVEQGITTGVTAAEFKPDDICKRGQIVSFLYRYAKGKAVGVNPFNDVKADAYYYDAVLWAVENGVTGGTTATTFSPANTCTRAQVVTFLYRWMVK